MKQTFWDEGNNFVIESTDKGEQNYKELIISTLIDREKRKFETIRIVFGKSQLYPIYQGFITNNLDNTQSEQKVDLELFKSLCKTEFMLH